mmetsp:Transcript_6467/g.10058  ORF Transcript_6467/g.10058 Transcript_6467/m.10058 type:complete len:86 (-) Transcript_6467:99-356(-)|eukprot:CAMPEP_0175096000 /NCGR_PEP_ID=MMETSP0086_2-20121207/4484_1 /TAXON_ID=136419 /ORGANISM="Unknown Unknown, Strain D1" /LENGTH=85 /DNA_ID=CAMNT_0016369343 /DNA_START=23 /DNA_END=280 /DNA_ORIENTATION=-
MSKCGAFGADKDWDDTAQAVFDEVKNNDQVAALVNPSGTSYSSQVVAGVNYALKIKHDGGVANVKVFKPLPHTGNPAEVTAFEAA